MNHADPTDRQAAIIARQYMGRVAWPTVVLALTVAVTYLGTVAMAVTGYVSLWLAVPVIAVLTYLGYTVLHESVHGSITGNRQSLRWLNKALGYIAAWITMIPLTAHRHEHIAHHRHANDETRDPDFHVGQMRSSLWAPATTALHAWVAQFTYYGKTCWKDASAQQNLVLCLEVFAALAPRLMVFAAGYWLEAVALFVVAWIIGAIVLIYLFAYIVHLPHDISGRWVDTSTILLPGRRGTVLTWLWVYQNYHSIHHLFPRVPFYYYAKVYEELEDIMIGKGAPVYRVTARGLQTVSL